MLNLPKNIYIVSLVMSLNFAAISMMVLIAGLLGAKIAPKTELATLPIAMMVVGTAMATIPAALIMQKIGRKAGLAVGIVLALMGAALAFIATINGNFWLFVFASTLIGFNAAFTQQGRFVILENAQNQKQQADGLTLALMANLCAAIIGPMLGAYGKGLMPTQASYAGSFLLICVVLIIAVLVLTTYRNLAIPPPTITSSQRPLKGILSQPIFILVAGSAAIGYGVMSFVMTSTSISMHEINGHSLEHTTFVIQSHLVAMFLPSILTGYLLKRGFGISLIFAGLSLYIIVCLIALAGQSVAHYWWALILLGIGWNLLFMTSTSLLPHVYTESDKFKTQAANDFLVFSVQAISAFAAGWVLFSLGWQSVIWIALGLSLVWICSTGLLNQRFLKESLIK